MVDDANPSGPPTGAEGDEARFVELGEVLLREVVRVVPGWIERLVSMRVGFVPEELRAEVERAGEAAAGEATARIAALVATDLDEQRTNPLAVLRDVTAHAHRVLAEAGVPPVERDDFSRRSFPDDVYGLVPATWADIDPALHDAGIAWGAAKAFVFKARRRDEGRT